MKFVFAAAALALTAPLAQAQEPTAETVETAPSDVQVNVKGMVCDFCARAVTKVFGKNDAVDTVNVDLDNGVIAVGLKPGKTLSDDDIETMVKKSGYALTSIERAAT